MAKPADGNERTRIERGALHAFVALLTIAAVAVILPYWEAVMWGGVLALLFHPMQQRLARRWGGRQTPAALATLLFILVIVVVPLAFVGVTLIQEVTALVQKVKSGEINVGTYFDRILAAAPSWLYEGASRIGLDNLGGLQQRITATITQRGQAIAGWVLSYGSDAIDVAVSFVVAMYLLFFLLRDGPDVAARIRRAIPLDPKPRDVLLERFVTVMRATVKGNVIVAAIQGALGGIALWVLGIPAPMLWAVVMAFLSLLPAVGAAIVWAPVALYLIATGEVAKGFGLILYGTFVIGLVDNLLRPVLVGKDIHLPDYVVLIATIGGLAVIGINGFVVGPLAVALCFAAWELLAERRGALVKEEEEELKRQAADGGRKGGL